MTETRSLGSLAALALSRRHGRSAKRFRSLALCELPSPSCYVAPVRELYAISLRERLPAFGIPLRQNEQPAPLDLQALIDRCYENGWHDDINYAEAPLPALEPDEAAWADALLKSATKRR